MLTCIIVGEASVQRRVRSTFSVSTPFASDPIPFCLADRLDRCRSRLAAMEYDPEDEAQAAFASFSSPAVSAVGLNRNNAAGGAPPSSDETKSSAPMPTLSTSDTEGVLLLLVFIHGFKGSAETTFEDFPSRLAYILSKTYPALRVESTIYPTYDTRGQLSGAVDNFVEWLIATCVNLESKPLIDDKTGAPKSPKETGRGGGAGSVKIILCCHSMGGLVGVDAALNVAKEGGLRDGKLWPRICSIIAYDTPFYGVHPGVFKNSVDKYSGYIKTAQEVGSTLAPLGAALGGMLGFGAATSNAQRDRSNNGRNAGSGASSWMWATGAAALAAGAAGAGIYANRNTLSQSYTWVSDHLDFVGNLWDSKNSEQRVKDIQELPQVSFHCYYTRLSKAKSRKPGHDRTFIILPAEASPVAASFTPSPNTVANDEVEAHVTMFNGDKNDDYYRLGQESALVISRSLFEEQSHGSQKNAQKQAEETPDRAQGSRQGDAEIVQEQEAQKAQLQEEANEAAERADEMQEQREKEEKKKKQLEDLARGAKRSPAAPPEEPSPWM